MQEMSLVVQSSRFFEVSRYKFVPQLSNISKDSFPAVWASAGEVVMRTEVKPGCRELCRLLDNLEDLIGRIGIGDSRKKGVC